MMAKSSAESKGEEIRMAVTHLQHLILWRCYDICPLGPPYSPAKFLHLPTVRPVSKPLFFSCPPFPHLTNSKSPCQTSFMHSRLISWYKLESQQSLLKNGFKKLPINYHQDLSSFYRRHLNTHKMRMMF